jgi:hypothetical protein
MLVSVLPDSWPSAGCPQQLRVASPVRLSPPTEPLGPRGEQHINALTVHGVNSAKMKRMFADAEQLGLSDVDLARAASVSLLELRPTADPQGWAATSSAADCIPGAISA